MYEIFEKLIKEKGITAYRVAKETGLGTSTFSDWKIGRSAPKIDKLKKIADYLEVDIDYLTGISNDRSINKTTVENVNIKKATKIPVLGSVPAGIPLEAIEDIIDYEEIDDVMAKTGEFFGLRITGSSMEPRMLEGDIVIVRKQSDVDSGDVAIVMVNGDEATCKKVIKKENALVLVGYNPSFTPIYFTAEEVNTKPVRIIGKVVQLRGNL